jgi:hypothetical protein
MMRLPIEGGLVYEKPCPDCGSGLEQRFGHTPVPELVEFSILTGKVGPVVVLMPTTVEPSIVKIVPEV